MSAVVVELPGADAPPPPRPARKRAAAGITAPPKSSRKAAAGVGAVPTGEVSSVPVPAPLSAPAYSPFSTWADRPYAAAITELCEFLLGHGSGGHLAAFARSRGFGYLALRDWLQADPVRAALYERAREERADILADEITEIADAPAETAVEVARSRLRVEARKWAAARLKPRAYGDKAGVGGVGDLPPLQHVHEMSDEALLGIARKAAGKAGKGRAP